MDQRQNLKASKAKSRASAKYQQGVRQVVSREEVEKLRHDVSQSLAEGSHSPNLFTTSISGASESSSEIQQVRQERDHLSVHGRILETEPPACQSAVRFLAAQVAQIRQVKVMLEVERRIFNLISRSCSLCIRQSQISQQLNRSKEEVAQLQARCHEYRHLHEPTQYARDGGYLSQKLKWMQMEETLNLLPQATEE